MKYQLLIVTICKLNTYKTVDQLLCFHSSAGGAASSACFLGLAGFLADFLSLELRILTFFETNGTST